MISICLILLQFDFFLSLFLLLLICFSSTFFPFDLLVWEKFIGWCEMYVFTTVALHV